MHHLESRHDLRQRDATVLLPVVERLRTLHKDDKGVIFAVQDHFGLETVSARHLDSLVGWVGRGDVVVCAERDASDQGWERYDGGWYGGEIKRGW